MYFFLSFFYFQYLSAFNSPNNSEKQINGSLECKIKKIKKSKSIKNLLQYKVQIINFTSKANTLKPSLNKNLPCYIYINKNNRPSANYTYLFTGTLIINKSQYIFKLNKKNKLEKLKKTYNLVDLRFDIKNKLKTIFFYNHFDNDTANLLSALITGDIDDKFLLFSFGRLGLQHILAISGFHFGIIIFFANFLFSSFLKIKKTLIILLFISTFYIIFLGESPSILRTYLTIQLMLFAKLTTKYYSPINILSASMLIQLLLDPLICLNIAFQLTFTCCYAIFLIYPNINNYINKKKLHSKPKIKIFQIINEFIMTNLILALSINLLIFPIILFHFQKFEILSLFYNIIIIPLILLIMLLTLSFIITYIFFPIHILIKLILKIVSFFCLSFVFYPPFPILCTIRYSNISACILIIYLTFVTFINIFLQEKNQNYHKIINFV